MGSHSHGYVGCHQRAESLWRRPLRRSRLLNEAKKAALQRQLQVVQRLQDDDLLYYTVGWLKMLYITRAHKLLFQRVQLGDSDSDNPSAARRKGRQLVKLNELKPRGQRGPFSDLDSHRVHLLSRSWQQDARRVVTEERTTTGRAAFEGTTKSHRGHSLLSKGLYHSQPHQRLTIRCGRTSLRKSTVSPTQPSVHDRPRICHADEGGQGCEWKEAEEAREGRR